MKKFELIEDNEQGAQYILHNLEPCMKLLVNKNNEFEYDRLNDVYDLFEFKGNLFALIIADSDFDIDEVEDLTYIRSIIKKSWRWYKSQVYIERFIPEELKEGEFETERYLLQPSSEDYHWLLTDKENKIVLKWKEHLFNETQAERELEKLSLSVAEISSALREMADWLRENHYNKLF